MAATIDNIAKAETPSSSRQNAIVAGLSALAVSRPYYGYGYGFDHAWDSRRGAADAALEVRRHLAHEAVSGCSRAAELLNQLMTAPALQVGRYLKGGLPKVGHFRKNLVDEGRCYMTPPIEAPRQ